MQQFLIFNPYYELFIQEAFQHYAIGVLYGDIVLGNDIIEEYQEDDIE